MNQKQKTRLIIFDLDGTLLNTIDDLAMSTNHALRQYGYPEHDLPAYRYFVGNGITKLIERALPEEARKENTITQLRTAFVTYYQKHKTDLTLSRNSGIAPHIASSRHPSCRCIQQISARNC